MFKQFIKKSRKQAFTLIELAIIIAIIGVMSAVAVTQMMDLSGSAEEALLEDYLQKLNTGVAQFMAANGRMPDNFGEFSATATALDADKGITVPLLVSKKGDPICSASTSKTLTCNGAGLRARQATYTLANGSIKIVITRKTGAAGSVS
jgi:type II secretory pathway pseudopilin PulG